MEASAQRLYEAARVLRGVIGQTNVAKLLNESPQTVKNWESRGVSDAGAIKAEGVIGCRAYWLATGEGEMHERSQQPPATSPPTHPPQISLADALPVVLGRLAAGLGDYRAGQVLQALQSATRPGAPLEDIERDLLQWLSEPPGSAAPPAKRQTAG